MTALWTMAAAAMAALFFICSLTRSAMERRGLWVAAGACAGVGLWSMWSAGLIAQTKGFQLAALMAIAGAILVRPTKERAPISREVQQEDAQAIRPARPTGNGFADIAGMDELKASLLEAAREALKRGGSKTRNGILLFGDPGNGKTIFAEKLAEELRIPMYAADITQINSHFVGETTTRLLAIVAEARRNAPSLLFLDEAESLLEARDEVGRSGGAGASDINRTTNALLVELVKLRGSGVVIVAATNFLDRCDAAAIREGRFDWKIEVTAPDEPARLALLSAGLAQHGHSVLVSADLVRNVARRWKGFSVKRILAVAEEAGRYASKSEKRRLDYDDLRNVLRAVQGPRAAPPEGTKSLCELVMLPEQRHALQSMATRLQNAFDVEQAGGTVPTGILLIGPPGTGKTESARALAKAAGYTFFPITGSEIIRDPDRLRKLQRDALNMRPAVIFVDEADDVLGERSTSPHKDATNRLLTMMDGAGGRVPDLLYIAATNHPEAIDRAALRGGRFTEKLEITPADAEAMTPWIAKWLAGKGWTSQLSAEEIAARLAGEPMANVGEVLQQALNIALTESADFSARLLRAEHLAAAEKRVFG